MDVGRWLRSRFGIAAAFLLCVLLAVNIYRAGHQSITIDEAYTYHKHIAAWKFWTFWEFTANNHVLNTLLGKLSIRLFGLSELTLRLPSLLGGLVYFVVIFRISRLLFGDSLWFLLSVGLNCLNPLILDFLSAARGYGMGLAFLCLGVFYCLEYLTPAQPLRPGDKQTLAVKTGAALGLAVAAQLTYAVPGVALVSVLAFIAIAGSVLARQEGVWADVLKPVLSLILSGTFIAVAILAWPMRKARPGDFYVGDPTFGDSLRSLVDGSLLYKPTVLDALPFVHRVLFDHLPDLLMAFLAGTLLVIAIATLRRRKQDSVVRLDRKRFVLLLSLTLTCWVILAILQLFVARPFPDGRTALYFLPLTSCACLLGARSVGNRLAIAGVAAALFLVLQYALQFNVSYYRIYRNNAGVKTLVSLIRRRPSQDGSEITIGASWYLADSINFYKEMYKADWVPVTRDGPDCNYSYYLLAPDDASILDRYNLEQLSRDEVSGVLLAKPKDSTLAAFEAIYPPPVQHSPPCRVDPEKLGPTVRPGDADAGPHIVRDIQKGCPTPWTYERPMLLFRVARRQRVKFVMHFVIPDVVLSQTGPLTVSLWINNKRLNARVYRTSGEQIFDQPVPADLFGPYRLTGVEIRLDKYYVVPKDGVKMGFILVDAGFVPWQNE